MISVYKIFQFIFGTIASIFILTFLIQYTGIYSGLQEQTHSLTILKNFNKLAGDVYLTGNPIDYHDFSNFNLGDCYVYFNEPDSPVIKCGSIDYPNYLPMVFHSGDDVLIDTSQLDMGWWEINFLMVYPELKIIFNPTTDSLEVTKFMRNITSIFNCEWGIDEFACNDIKNGGRFPTALQLEPRVKFGFCNGNILIYDNLCAGKSCERYDFLGILRPNDRPGQYSLCRAELPSKYYKVVTISDTCSVNLERGVCIETPVSGIGRMRIAGSQKNYWYKDIFDIIAFIMGADEKNSLNKPMSETNYIFKNEVILRRISLASNVMAKKMEILLIEATDKCCPSINYANGLCSPLDDLSCECVPIFDILQKYLCSQENSICQLSKGNYFDVIDMRLLKERMDISKSIYEDLVKVGCENV